VPLAVIVNSPYPRWLVGAFVAAIAAIVVVQHFRRD
jgi:hypothetical protein